MAALGSSRRRVQSLPQSRFELNKFIRLFGWAQDAALRPHGSSSERGDTAPQLPQAVQHAAIRMPNYSILSTESKQIDWIKLRFLCVHDFINKHFVCRASAVSEGERRSKWEREREMCIRRSSQVYRMQWKTTTASGCFIAFNFNL